MSSTTTNNRNNITNEQLLILRHYMDQYNRTSNQINRLMTELEHIRHNLDYFSNEIFLNRNQNTNNNTVGGAARNNINNRTNNSNRRLNSLLSSFLNTNNTNNTTNTNFSPITYNFDEPIGLNNFLNTFLSTTVPVVPTQDQINNATRSIRYENIQNPLNESCPISLERFNPNDVVTQICWCGHIFNTNELTSWFRNNVRCPVCRYDIRNYETNRTTTTPANATTIPANDTTIPANATTIPANANATITSTANSNIPTSSISTFLNNIFTSGNSSSDRIVYDPVSNILMYETNIESRPSNNNTSNSNINDSDTD